MGMSASQARLLFISSRMHDIEMKSQNIANQKIRLASDSEQVSANYVKALNKQNLMVTDPLTQNQSQLNYASIMSPKGVLSGAHQLQTASGKVVVSSAVADAFVKSTNLADFMAKFGVVDLSAAREAGVSDLASFKNVYRDCTFNDSKGTVKFPAPTLYKKENSINVSDSSGSLAAAKAGGMGVSSPHHAVQPSFSEDAVAEAKSDDSIKLSVVDNAASLPGGKSTSSNPQTTTYTKVQQEQSKTSIVDGYETYTIDYTEEKYSEKGYFDDRGLYDEVQGSEQYEKNTWTEVYRCKYSEAQKTEITNQYEQLLEGISDTTDNSADVSYYTNLYNEMSKNNRQNYQAYDEKALNNTDYLQYQLENGEWFISQRDEDGVYNKLSLSTYTLIGEVSDKVEIAKAEAEYNAETLKINNKEKILDNELKKLDTEHNALNTEYDSVQNLIKNNTDKSFNLFS